LTIAPRDWKNRDVKTYPRLDLESAYFYYDYANRELKKIGDLGYPNDIRAYCDRFSALATKVGATALAATADIKETVD
jgi:hypothetical protein